MHIRTDAESRVASFNLCFELSWRNLFKRDLLLLLQRLNHVEKDVLQTSIDSLYFFFAFSFLNKVFFTL